MLVMQMRNEAIIQKRSEVQHTQRRHNALLRALFETTQSTLKINNVQQPQKHDLDSFLEANNIRRGRPFDPSSLPPTDSLLEDVDVQRANIGRAYDSLEGAGQNVTRVQGKLQEEREHGSVCPGQPGQPPALLREDGQSSWIKDGSSSTASAPERPANINEHSVKPVKEVESSNTGADSGTDYKSSGDPGLRPFGTLPLSSEDAGSMQPSIFDEVNAEQRTGNAISVHLPPIEVQEGRFENLDQETNSCTEQSVNLVPRAKTSTHGVSSPTSEKDAGYRSSEENEVNQPRPVGIMKSQMDIVRAEAFGRTASTPDEQLRLEEAQSMQSSKALDEPDEGGSRSMPPPASRSAEFIYDSMMDVDAVPGISVGEEATAEQDDAFPAAPDMQEDSLASPMTGLRDHVIPGMNGDPPKDLTLSRRPPMRIDTGLLPGSDSTSAAAIKSNAINLPTPSEIITPNKAAAGNVQSPPERMTTRVSSGALRHKSVSEILGETPRITPTQVDKNTFARASEDFSGEDPSLLQTPKSASSFPSPDPATFKQRLTELKEKERSKLSTVVFASSRNPDVAQARHLEKEDFSKKDRDYMLTLFNFQVTSPPRALPLNSLVKSAHKTLSTADHSIDLSERQACRVLNKIYDLQARNCWSLRQIERAAEPARPVTHQDVLLGEMKWMRTDFREERKWKLAAAKFTADACAVWVGGNAEERRSLQVKIRAQPAKGKSRSDSISTPDLVHSADDEASEVTDDDCIGDAGSAPAAIFSLPPEMFVFGLKNSPIAEKLLLELPLYQPTGEVQNAALLAATIEPDAPWKKSIVPVSRYAEGKIVPVSDAARGRAVSAEDGPPYKRSRFDYHSSDLRRSNPGNVSDVESVKVLEPEQDDVALFDPEYKHIRDRIHTGHAFRPPSEYIMPSQSFFESRSSSQWTQAEDDELRRIVKEYSYNWSLISSSLTLPSRFTSGAERRTPWECFERWISLEGLPVEMAKINYFRAYHARLQAAQKTVESNQLAQQQQHGGNAGQLPFRRRTTQPYSVERRKDQKHLHLIDAMRKLAKKREAQLNKQQHVASLAMMRKNQEGPKTRKEMHTPQEFSRLKYNQQVKMQEQARQYSVQVMQHQKAAQAARASAQTGQQANGVPPVRNPASGVPNGSSPNMTAINPHSQIRGSAGDPSRPALQMQRAVNGQTNSVSSANSHGVPHAPMQPNTQVQMQMQQRVAPGMAPDNRVLQEASRVHAQQQAYQQQIRQSGHPQPNGQSASPSMQNPNLLAQNNAAILASVQGRASPSINGVPPPTGSSTSPRMSQPQALSSGMTPAVNHISSQVKARHPQASPEQITRMTTDQLYKISEARHHAMQAAAGNANMNAVASNSNIGLQAPSPMQQAAMMANGGSPILNPAHYAQIMRTQQASQQRGANVNSVQGMNTNSIHGNGINANGMTGAGKSGSRSVTPLIQRTSSAQGGPRPSQSPSARPVGLAQ